VTVFAEIVYLYAGNFSRFTPGEDGHDISTPPFFKKKTMGGLRLFNNATAYFGSTAPNSAIIWLDPSFQVYHLQVILASLDRHLTIQIVTQAQALHWKTSSAANR
jgi:hypothetical protein